MFPYFSQTRVLGGVASRHDPGFTRTHVYIIPRSPTNSSIQQERYSRGVREAQLVRSGSNDGSVGPVELHLLEVRLFLRGDLRNPETARLRGQRARELGEGVEAGGAVDEYGNYEGSNTR